MRIHQIAMRVTDLAVMEAFYRDVVGVPFIARYDPPGLAFFDFDGVRVMFERSDEGTQAGNSILYLWAEDLDAAVAALQDRDVRFVQPPTPVHADTDGTFGRAGETEWMAFFEDPEGNTVALASRRSGAASPPGPSSAKNG